MIVNNQWLKKVVMLQNSLIIKHEHVYARKHYAKVSFVE